LAEAARLLALNLAHYQIRYGEIPLENFDQLMATQEIDAETERLMSRGKQPMRRPSRFALLMEDKSVEVAP